MNLGNAIGLPFVEGSIGTAIGIMMLWSVLGVRWAVGKWERAKKRWWEDWYRVVEGLGRDLEVGSCSLFQDLDSCLADHFGPDYGEQGYYRG